MFVFVTGFKDVGVSTICQSLMKDKDGEDWHILSHEITKETQLPERLDIGKFNPELVIVVTDSTLENVQKSSPIVNLMKDQFPHAHKIVIANMQNLAERLKPKRIEELLGLTTYGRQ
jgi:hypothetical protein